ncbi:CatB-related O-acetyltransferase [Pseudomonas sp. NPDC090201]|uniref:CatB-related O-acetyltransferase n=1 Tax=Pseudomonas sp. NPDC090201 TaxID=3364475 RepID=UPI0038145C0F
MQYLKDLYWKRWIRKRGAKLAGGLPSLSKRCELVIEDHVELGHLELRTGHVEIGAHTYIRSGTHLSLVSSIGRFCSIASDVYIGQEKYTHPSDWTSSHPFQYTDSPLTYTAPTELAVIGHDVWIGHSAMIMEGVTVGTGAIIATRAVVTQDVPPYAIVAGFPAKVIRYRHASDIIERLLASQWWERDVSELRTLPMDQPELFLQALEAGRASTLARYRKLSISRDGCREI